MLKRIRFSAKQSFTAVLFILLLPLVSYANPNYYHDSITAIDLINAEIEYLDISFEQLSSEQGLKKQTFEILEVAHKMLTQNLSKLRNLISRRLYTIQVRGNAVPEDLELVDSSRFQFSPAILDKPDDQQEDPMVYGISHEGKNFFMTLPIKHIIKKMRDNSAQDIEQTRAGLKQCVELMNLKKGEVANLFLVLRNDEVGPIYHAIEYLEHALELATSIDGIFGKPLPEKKPVLKKKTSQEKMEMWLPVRQEAKTKTRRKLKATKKKPSKSNPNERVETASVRDNTEAALNEPQTASLAVTAKTETATDPVSQTETEINEAVEPIPDLEVLVEFETQTTIEKEDNYPQRQKRQYLGDQARKREIELLRTKEVKDKNPDIEKTYSLKKSEYRTFLVLHGKEKGAVTDTELDRLIACFLEQSQAKTNYMSQKKGQTTVRINGVIFRYDPTHGKDAHRVYWKKASHVVAKLALAGITLDNVNIK